MAQPEHRPPLAVSPARLSGVYGAFAHREGEPEAAEDPFYYGWREIYRKGPNGQKQLERIPLTEKDLLNPQAGDFICESTVHREVIETVGYILREKCRVDPKVAVWCDLKISFKIPGLTTGPGPDICVLDGVEDRERDRRSFRYGKEPGKVRLVIEVVSKASLKKDFQDIFPIYNALSVEEYLVIHPRGEYADGPFELYGWRRDPFQGVLCPFPADAEGRLHSETTGILIGTGPQGFELRLWEAASGDRLWLPEEEMLRQKTQAEQALARACHAEIRADQAEEEREVAIHHRARAERAADQARRQAEQERDARRRAEQERNELARKLAQLQG